MQQLRLRPAALLKKTRALVFSREFCKIFINTFSYKTPTLIAFAYCVFIRKFAAAPKNLKTNNTFLVKPTCFLLIQEKNINDKFLTLTILDKYWHLVNLFYCKSYTRGVFRILLNIHSNLCNLLDILLGSKYASTYI